MYICKHGYLMFYVFFIPRGPVVSVCCSTYLACNGCPLSTNTTPNISQVGCSTYLACNGCPLSTNTTPNISQVGSPGTRDLLLETRPNLEPL